MLPNDVARRRAAAEFPRTWILASNLTAQRKPATHLTYDTAMGRSEDRPIAF